ncbi:AAA ATPase-like protein [Kribbella voronezhensis]|uniref:AAA ATPase-like protein n=1 Tax=Kribbella voronezhensis TaxID=2512212 RepID=A0A4R7TH77_9ACTN|nr:LuxR C-terminal-related transcriptional regulator [Kribbella voronezhensis]TDU91189.1 AAA ATPase-like protein [Kribbella voronezhensis]
MTTPPMRPPHQGGGLRSAARRSLHGREVEARRLSESVMAVAAGQGCVIVMEGKGGLGKSRLTREAVTWARRLGVAIAPAVADELPGAAPLAPLLAALRGCDPPILANPEFDPVHGRDYDAAWLIDQLEQALRKATVHQPLLITLDDMQWADSLTVVAARALTERLATSPVMWLLSRRPWPSGPMLDTLFSDLVAVGAVPLRLAPLPSEAVARFAGELLGAAPDGALLGLLDKCAGNPSIVVDLLTTLAEHDELIIDATHARLLPGSLDQRLPDWLSQVTPLTRQLLDVASIFGRTFDVPSVAKVLHRKVAELLPPVQEALGAGLLVEEGTQLGFQHDLIRDAVYRGLSLDARRRLHREAADALLATGGSVPDAAAHAISGAEPGDTDAVALLIRASDEMVAAAPGTAGDLRLRAVDLMAAADSGRPWRVMEAIGLLFLAGRSAEAQTLSEVALQDGLPAEVEARLRFQLADSLGTAGYSASALHHARTALGLADVEGSTRALLFAAESNAHLLAGDSSAALRAGEQAMATDMTPDRAGRALLTMGVAERVRGRLRRSLQLIDEAADLLAADAAGARRLEAHWARGRTLMALDRFDEAQAAWDAADRWAGEPGTAATEVFRRTCHALLLLHRGELADAVAAGNAGLSRAEELKSWMYVPELCAVLAEASAYRGEFGVARRRLRHGVSRVSEPRSVGAQRLAWATAVVDEAAGEEPVRVLAHLASLYEQLPDRLEALAFDPMAGPFLVGLARRADDARYAGIAAEATDSLSRINQGVISFAAAGLQAGGLLHGDDDRLVAAARAFEASPRPLARARAGEDAARGLLQHGRRAEAVEQLQLALADYDRAGAVVLGRRVRDRLGDLAGSGADRSAAGPAAFGWASMTTAELRVARLVATGLTNRAIADELDLSPHTVESHLRHTFRKLDVRSRVELTRVVLTREPTPGENDR